MKKTIFILSLMLTIVSVSCEAATIDKDTEMHPQGWISGAVVFKAGTDVILNDKGEVVSGTLKNNERLNIAGSGLEAIPSLTISPAAVPPNRLYFNNGTTITFNDYGAVIAGTLREDGFVSLSGNLNNFIKFKGGTVISFHPNNYVATGTIKSDTYLRPVGWENKLDDNGFIKYKAGTEITFNDKGEVTSTK